MLATVGQAGPNPVSMGPFVTTTRLLNSHIPREKTSDHNGCLKHTCCKRDTLEDSTGQHGKYNYAIFRNRYYVEKG